MALRTRWPYLLAALALAAFLELAAWPPAARAQAAAEYGVAASHSAASTMGISRVYSKLGQRIDQNSPRAKSVEDSMSQNRRQLAPKDPKNGGTVHIESTPTKATVYVDGMMVATTPADITLGAGQHDVEVRHPVSVTWEKEITVAKGDKLTFKPELKDKYKSVLSFTIQQ